MVTIRAQISSEDLLQAVEQLDEPALEVMYSHILTIRAQRKAPHLGSVESPLLQRINTPLPGPTTQRAKELNDKRQAETLTEAEYAELLALNAVIEAFDAERLEAMAQLAELRGLTLAQLRQQLGLDKSRHG